MINNAQENSKSKKAAVNEVWVIESVKACVTDL